MEDSLTPTARYASTEAKHTAAACAAAVLVDLETGRQELLVHVDPGGDHLSATLYGDGLEALGGSPVTLEKLSPRTKSVAISVSMIGYDSLADRCRQLEAALSVAWTVVGSQPATVDVVGTALVTSPETDEIISFRALRRHPFNHLEVDFEARGRDEIIHRSSPPTGRIGALLRRLGGHGSTAVTAPEPPVRVGA